MEKVTLVFNTVLDMVVQLWNSCLKDWSIFGTFILSFAILKKISRVFNKLKS